MIPPRSRRDEPTTEERQAEWEARMISSHIMNVVAGLERRGVGSLAVLWDVVAILLALLRKETANRGESWEKVEDTLNRDSEDWATRLGPQ